MSKTTNKILGSQDQPSRNAGVIQMYLNGNLLREIELGTRSIVIGRSPGCDVVLSDSSISRRHAKVLLQNGQIVVKDLGSAHGVIVNDVSVQEHRLRSKEYFSIVMYQFRFLSETDYKMEKNSQDDSVNTLARVAANHSESMLNPGAPTLAAEYYGAAGRARALLRATKNRGTSAISG